MTLGLGSAVSALLAEGAAWRGEVMLGGLAAVVVGAGLLVVPFVVKRSREAVIGTLERHRNSLGHLLADTERLINRSGDDPAMRKHVQALADGWTAMRDEFQARRIDLGQPFDRTFQSKDLTTTERQEMLTLLRSAVGALDSAINRRLDSG